MVLLKTLIEESKKRQKQKKKPRKKRKSKRKKKVRKRSEKTLTGITNLYKYKKSPTGYNYIYRINNKEYKNQDIWELKKIIREKNYPWEINDYYHIRKLVKEIDTNIYELIKK